LYGDICRAREKFEGKITILHGIEANLMSLDGRIDIKENDLKRFDIILMGFHKTAITLKSALHFYGPCKLPFTRKKAVEKTTDAYIKAMKRYPIDIVVHPNYATRVNVDRLSKAAAEMHVAIEINGHRNFMSDEELTCAKKNGAVFTINSDAHTLDRIGDTQGAVQDALRTGIWPELIINTQEGPGLRRLLKG
ncbi:hypothetical protein LJB83_03070, partial [Clostridia bacterium OttesenSCG-928-F22]|nr:hypothetical protein [Clostridia bacterium OttesenSCG-928-F22]